MLQLEQAAHVTAGLASARAHDLHEQWGAGSEALAFPRSPALFCRQFATSSS